MICRGDGMVDMRVSKTRERKLMRVRLPLAALIKIIEHKKPRYDGVCFLKINGRNNQGFFGKFFDHPTIDFLFEVVSNTPA